MQRHPIHRLFSHIASTVDPNRFFSYFTMAPYNQSVSLVDAFTESGFCAEMDIDEYTPRIKLLSSGKVDLLTFIRSQPGITTRQAREEALNLAYCLVIARSCSYYCI